MTHKKPSLPSFFLEAFGASKYMAILDFVYALDLELNSVFIRPLPKFISRFAWNDSLFSQESQFEDPFKNVYESYSNYTQGRLFE